MKSADVNITSFSNFNDFLHALRTREVQKIPGGAKVFLSAGCSGRWYFEWINENYPGITRHMGIEAYSPKPDDLSNEVVWLADQINDMSSVACNDVDLVFAGQTIEHLWPDQLAGFLSEAYRVLKPGGLIVLDSPNQFITKALNWYQPEHVLEMSVGEIQELVTLAGFNTTVIKGVWLCYDRDKNAVLPLLPPDLDHLNIETEKRVTAAHDHPKDSFIWWLEARKDLVRLPRMMQMSMFLESIYDREKARWLERVFTQKSKIQMIDKTRIIKSEEASPDKAEVLRYGPYMPLRSGTYMVCFNIGFEPNAIKAFSDTDLIAMRLDVCTDNGSRILAQKDLRIADLEVDTSDSPNSQSKINGDELHTARYSGFSRLLLTSFHFTQHELALMIKEVTFGVEFRVFTMGIIPVVVGADIQLIEMTH